MKGFVCLSSLLKMPKKAPSSLLYLLQIERELFPFTVCDPEDVAHVRMLVSAGLLDATIPAPSAARETFGHQPPATVSRLTRYGRLEVERLKKLEVRR